MADALAVLAGHISDTGNKEAAEYYERLQKMASEPHPDRITLKALWTGLKSAVPTVKDLVGVATEIEGLF